MVLRISDVGPLPCRMDFMGAIALRFRASVTVLRAWLGAVAYDVFFT